MSDVFGSGVGNYRGLCYFYAVSERSIFSTTHLDQAYKRNHYALGLPRYAVWSWDGRAPRVPSSCGTVVMGSGYKHLT